MNANISGNTLGNGFTQPNVNPLNYPSESCSCGNEVFIPGIIFKKVPGVVVGQGSEEVQVPIKVFVCSKCGELSPIDKETLEKNKKVQEDVKKSNLII